MSDKSEEEYGVYEIDELKDNLDNYLKLINKNKTYLYEEKEISSKKLHDNIKILMALTSFLKREKFYDEEGEFNLKKAHKYLLKYLIDNIYNILLLFAKYVVMDEKGVLDQVGFIELWKQNPVVSSLIDTILSEEPKPVMNGMIQQVIYDSDEKSAKFMEVVNSSFSRNYSPGMNIGMNYILSRELTEDVWVATRFEREYAIRFISLEKFFHDIPSENKKKFNKDIAKLLKLGNWKDKKEMRKRSVQSSIRVELKSIEDNYLVLQDVGYYSQGNVMFEAMEYIPNSIETLQKIDKKVLILKVLELLKSVAITGFVLGNLSPSKILVKVTKKKKQDEYHLYLYDFSSTVRNGEDMHRSKSGYDSYFLYLEKNKEASFYDDMESVMYIIDYIFNKTTVAEEDKKNLKNCSESIADVIRDIREFQQNDESEFKSTEDYGISLYKKKKTPYARMLKFYNSINIIEPEEVSLTPVQKELYNKMFNEMIASGINKKMSTDKISQYALQRTFTLMYGCTYDTEDDEDTDDDDEDSN